MWDHQRDSRVEKEPGTRGVAGTGPWQLKATECAPPSPHGWHQPSPDGRNYVSGHRLCRCVEEKGDPAGPTAAREFRISPAPGRRCLLQRPRRLRKEPGVRPGSWMGTQDTLEGLSPARPLLTSGSHQALPPLHLSCSEDAGPESARARTRPRGPIGWPGQGRGRGSSLRFVRPREVQLRTLEGPRFGSPSCSAGPTGLATGCRARGARPP